MKERDFAACPVSWEYVYCEGTSGMSSTAHSFKYLQNRCRAATLRGWDRCSSLGDSAKPYRFEIVFSPPFKR